jgi:DNA excision repair protein ERCC-4
VYFLMYADSIEEHRYIASLKREKQAFENLIHKKTHLAIELPDTVQAIQHASASLSLPSDSRNKINKDKPKPTIVVDMREFGSSLPSTLHLHNFMIQPVTLLVIYIILGYDAE